MIPKVVFALFKTKAFQATVWLLLLFTTIWIGQQISYVFRPLVVLVTTLFLPVLISGLLYYLINPAVDFLSKGRIPRVIAIILIYVVFFGMVFFAVIAVGPVLGTQLNELIDNAPAFLTRLYEEFLRIQDSGILARFEVFDPFSSWQSMDFAALIDNILQAMADNILSLTGFVASFAVIVFSTPFILFYMLKDGRRFPGILSRMLPEPYQKESIVMLKEMSATLRSYVQGQLLVSLFVATFVYFGYRLVGLEYALLLALIAGVTNIIPYFGPIIGTLPGLIVGLIQSPWTGLQVLLVILVVQQIESQFISPQVLGKKLALHPVLIIFVLLTSASLAGFFGLILGIPIFAVMRVVVIHLVAFITKSRALQKNPQ